MKKLTLYALSSILLLSTTLVSCGNKVNGVSLSSKKPTYQLEDHTDNYINDIYKNYYQILVYSYFDSNKDGIGDLKGLTQKLDYINDGNPNSKTSLGYDGIYLLPIFPSPTYHKYDATDYYSIDKSYGTMSDFDNFISEANKRGIDVILDLAINHTSTQHTWFTQAMSAVRNLSANDYDKTTGEPSDEAKKNYPALHYYHIVHKDFTKEYGGTDWYVIGGTNNTWFYEASFYDGMPDLNLDDPVVLNEVKNIMKFWLDKGVSGFRLDAVQHYFDWNKSKNYDLLNQLSMWGKELTANRDKDCFLVAEGPWSDTVEAYYKNTNDISYMNFNYGQGGPGKLLTTVNNSALYNKKIEELTKAKEEILYSDPSSGKSYDIINSGEGLYATRCAADYFRKIVENWDNKLFTANENAIDSNFGVNHDTMRAINSFAANFKGNDLRDACKFFWGLNNTLSGISFNYYGEEIGMKAGSTSDPDKRHPMYWSDNDKEGITVYAPGATPTTQYLEPVDSQMKNDDSLWNFMRELNLVKKYFPEIARGKQKFVTVGKTFALMEKSYEDSKVYLLYNFSNKASSIKLDELGLEEVPTEIKYSLTSSTSYYAKLSAGSINVPAYSITII